MDKFIAKNEILNRMDKTYEERNNKNKIICEINYKNFKIKLINQINDYSNNNKYVVKSDYIYVLEEIKTKDNNINFITKQQLNDVIIELKSLGYKVIKYKKTLTKGCYCLKISWYDDYYCL